MRRIGKLTLVAVAALAIAGGFARAATTTATVGTTVAREAQPGDDRGGHGGDDVRLAREAQPGDDRGGHGGDDGSDA